MSHVRAELQKGAFAKVRWMRNGLPTLYAMVNLNTKSEGHVLKYEQVRSLFSNLQSVSKSETKIRCGCFRPVLGSMPTIHKTLQIQ